MTENIIHIAGKSSASHAVQTIETKLVVFLTFFRIAEDIIGLSSLLEFLFGLLIIRISIRMIFHGHLPICLLYFLVSGILGNAQHFIIISFCHNSSPLTTDYNLSKADYFAVKRIAFLGCINYLVLLVFRCCRKLSYSLVFVRIEILSCSLHFSKAA